MSALKRLRDWITWRFIIRQPRLRRLITCLLVPDREEHISLLGAPLVINARQELGYRRAAAFASKAIALRDEAPTLLSLALILRPGDTFVDIGANIGLYSSVLSRIQNCHPDITFHAFEANPATATRLRKTLVDTQVQIHEAALADKPRTLRFRSGAASGAFGASDQPGDFQEAGAITELEARPLADFPIPGDSLVLKIDVEGLEWEVIQGAKPLFTAQRVRAVYLDGYDDPRIPDFLRSHGFHFYCGRDLTPLQDPNGEFSLLALKNQ